MTPQVSILLSTHRDRSTLPRALEPFLASPLDLEIVLVDDGSRDGTREYLAGLPRERLKVMRMEEPIGLTKALNLAARAARGAFLARQDADDFSHADRLEKQLARFRQDRGLDILGTGHRIVDSDGAVLAEIHGRNFRNLGKRLLKDNIFCHGSLMFKADSFRKLNGYREFFRFSQDYDLVLRACHMGLRMENLAECLYDWSFSTHSITGSKAGEQARYAETARRVRGNPDLDPEAAYRALAGESAGSTTMNAIPADRKLMEIYLRAGDTNEARRAYHRLKEAGMAGPERRKFAFLSSLPPWLYRGLRSLSDLRYQ